jgi:hypothetical protein
MVIEFGMRVSKQGDRLTVFKVAAIMRRCREKRQS